MENNEYRSLVTRAKKALVSTSTSSASTAVIAERLTGIGIALLAVAEAIKEGKEARQDTKA